MLEFPGSASAPPTQQLSCTHLVVTVVVRDMTKTNGYFSTSIQYEFCLRTLCISQVRLKTVLKIVWLKQQFWSLGVQERHVGSVISPESSFLASRQLPSMCPHMAFLCVCKSPCLSPYKDASHIGLGSHFYDPI